ncbi:hypothetical protein SDC9_172365 [bioreactor metagenome]|uniref:Uncharacterized protein n=1 Tax=bioreactor metagenome TaxID=1076179 RepID=A0A645GGP3_9ZZZZ
MHFRTLETQTHLQVLLVADQHVDVFDDGGEHPLGFLLRIG